MKRITNVTKRQIKELFQNGVDVGIFESDIQRYLYWGGFDNELSFLKRLYQLDKMPSNDSRYQNAEGDIVQHTINNDDWELCWVFEDERFPLHDGTDEDYLRFLIEVFNPEICVEGDLLKKYFSQIQGFLREDGYELYPSHYISGKPIYSWRLLTEKEIKSLKFLPFSVRFEDDLNTKKITLPKIAKVDRKKVFDLMSRYEETCYLTTETGWNYTKPTKEAVWDNLKEYYCPKAFNSNKKYENTDSFEDFIMANFPQCVFDVIELYYRFTEGQAFEGEINKVIGKYGYNLVSGKIQSIELFQTEMVLPQNDDNLRELLQRAQSFSYENNSDSIQSALEKIWDAYERVKTSYGNDKQKTLKKLEEEISCGSMEMSQYLENEFAFLSKLGNNYQIRHFEKSKKAFPSDAMKKYFYNRCASLVNLCVSHLNNSGL